jgi:homoserine dehydrogenase
MTVQNLTIGMFGLGTVGSGVVELLNRQGAELENKYGVRLKLKRIVVRDVNKPRPVKVDPQLLSANPADILDDGEINTVIEVMGGVDPAQEYISQALKQGKHVITANKAVLAAKGAMIFKQALKSNCYLGFRAAVTGSQDIIERISSAISINTLVGVFNGTCNYILTQMEEHQQDLETVLKKAQELGYAEQEPSLDIDGYDTTDKLAILCILAFGCAIRRQDIFTEGIRNITLEDIRFASELNYRIKLLGIARYENGCVEARVHPCLVPRDNMLARLEGVENGIQIDDELRGQGGFTAPGAGKYPTACAIMFDIINVATRNPVYFPRQIKRMPLKSMSSLECEYYLRLNALNQPGVLERIAGVFRRNDINIMSVLQQKGADYQRGTIIPLVIIVDKSQESNVQKAVRHIQALDAIQGKVSLIRVEKSLW